ncbi:carboxypeptidase-like regulatory domain-containing protein [Mariniphaga sediminis]|uniref:Carboxypeptidase-like regulatory domain-containing protein n=1 Tax=Mariniphaga sediminis TaxID=1628158 RepID=A0A399CWP7_9BACT|nr:carboxypeptidase-like regulatory domain-containing protein [Mariniphaga sediminis]RIH64155.1 carboxypeptidase-like regulatory domain-containing protein [Mariniphaga sediminis]
MKTHLFYFLFWVILFLPGSGWAQLLSISGYVKNNVSGQAIQNATIFESVSGIGTISNNDGYYKLLLNPGEQSLKISFSGFNVYTSTFELEKDTVISVQLKPEILPANKYVAGAGEKKGVDESAPNENNPRKRK